MLAKNFIITLEVYPFDIMCSFGQTDEQLKKSLNKHHLIWDDMCKLRGNGKYVMFPCGASLIRMPYIPETNEDYGTLQHEIFHATTFILDKIGMEMSLYKSDEAYAYLIGWLTTKIYNKLC